MSGDPMSPPPRPTEMLMRRVPAKRGVSWLTEAWRLFTRAPLTWLGLSASFWMIQMLSTILRIQGIISFLLIGGAMYASHELQQGRPFRAAQLYRGFQRSTAQLALAGLLYQIAILLCTWAAVYLASAMGYPPLSFDISLETTPPDPEAMLRVLQSYEMTGLIFLGLLIPVMMAIWFAPALIMLQGATPLASLKFSFIACQHNIKAFTVFGLISAFALVVALNILAAITYLLPVPTLGAILMVFFVLLVVTLILATTYTAYIDIFVPMDQSNVNHPSPPTDTDAEPRDQLTL